MHNCMTSPGEIHISTYLPQIRPRQHTKEMMSLERSLVKWGVTGFNVRSRGETLQEDE